MPGATPYQGVQAFLAPLERAVACLGTGKIVVSPHGRADTSKTHSWSLNAGEGLLLRGDAAGCRFLASMHYRIVPTDPEEYDIQEGRLRVTTSAYLYEFRTPDNMKLWATSCPGHGRRTRHRRHWSGDAGLHRVQSGHGRSAEGPPASP